MILRWIRLVLVGCLLCPVVSAEEPRGLAEYVGAEIIDRQPPVYPFVGQRRAYEGWVDVAFTVAADSTIKNIEVVAHSGIEAFVEPAIQSVAKYKYKAATLNAEPVDSLQEIRIIFMIRETPRGANKQFVKSFRSFRSAIAAEEFDKAAEYLVKLRNLKADNLYEDAFLNLAEFYYGLVEESDPREQIRRLDAATRVINGKPYIAKTAWIDSMHALFVLQARASDFGAALHTYGLIPEGKKYTELRTKLLPSVIKILNLRVNQESYVTELKLNRTGFANIQLLKPVFSATQLRGEIHRLQLICDAGIKSMEFLEGAEYRIPPSYGSCSLRVKGAPDTEFSLVQLPVAESQTP